MEPGVADLRKHFDDMDRDEVALKVARGELTPEAMKVARQVLAANGMTSGAVGATAEHAVAQEQQRARRTWKYPGSTHKMPSSFNIT